MALLGETMLKSKHKICAIIIIIIILLSIIVFGIFCAGKGTASASGIKTFSVDEYLKLMGKGSFSETFENMEGENNTAYVLRYSAKNDFDYKTVSAYAVYVPCAGEVSLASLETTDSVFGCYLRLMLEESGEAGNAVFCITFHSDKEMDVRVYIDGKRMNTEISDVDYNPIPPAKQ